MRPSTRSLWRLAIASAALVCLAFACSDPDDGSEFDDDDDATGGSGGVDDRYRPPASGVHISEEAACEMLRVAFQSKALALKCSKTVRTCPGFVRTLYDPDCVEYDEGSVQGCAEFYGQVFSCDLLIESECVVTVYPGTEPAGCP